MKYFLVNQSCGPLFIDIVNAFANTKLDSILITGQVNQVQNPVNSQIRFVKLNRYNRSTVLKRLISWFLFTFLLFFKVLFSASKSKWLLTTNPPFAPWLSGLLKVKKSKVVLLVYDIYPEVLAASNIVSTSHLLYRAWFSITQKTYKNADRIICIGDSMAEYLISQNDKLQQKISIIPNWNIINFTNFAGSESLYKKQRGAIEKIHVVYSGNLGATHDFSTILETAKTLQMDERFVFSIIGEGYQAEKIRDFIKQNNLKNIVWETFKPANKVTDIFLSADIFLVTLGPGVEKSSIPSKTYDALAAGSALLVVAPEGSELEKLVNTGKVGKCFHPGTSDNVVEWLKELAEKQGKLNQYKEAAHKLSKQYSPENAKKYVDVLTTL